MNPEGGTFTQRLAALPSVLSGCRFPDAQSSAWKSANLFDATMSFWFELGNDTAAMLRSARTTMVVLSLVLAACVYAYSALQFGAIGGLVSLALYALCPTVLANAPLATADTGCSLFFFLSVIALWRMLHRVTIATVLFASLAVAALLLSKFSGALLLPLACAMLALRFVGNVPLARGWLRRTESIPVRSGAGVLTLVGSCASTIALVVLFIWSAYGFRYDGIQGADVAYSWARDAKDGAASEVVYAARDAELMPECFLFGLAFTLRSTAQRRSYLVGVIANDGRIDFFPRAVLYKTRIPTLVLLATSAIVLALSWRRTRPRCGEPGSAYALAPILLLSVTYGVMALASSLNIGIRHLLPLYPCAYVLAGALGPWLREQSIRAIGVATMLAWLAVESIAIWPDYLAYFSPVVGGPANGHKHLVDSSLDWGQDLIGLKKWIDADRARRKAPADDPVYVSYFGPTPPSFVGIDATLLPGTPHPMPPPAEAIALKPGVYCVSASMLSSVLLARFPGRRCAQYEEEYTRARQMRKLYSDTEGNATAREPRDAEAARLRRDDRVPRRASGRVLGVLLEGRQLHVLVPADRALVRVLAATRARRARRLLDPRVSIGRRRDRRRVARSATRADREPAREGRALESLRRVAAAPREAEGHALKRRVEASTR